MAHDLYIKIDGIEGEARDASHLNELDVLSWSWKVQQEATPTSGKSTGAGKANVSALEFEHYVDRASPNLMKFALTGKTIPKAVFTARKSGGNPVDFLKITMTDILVNLVQPYGSGGSEPLREKVHLSFAKVTQEYVVQNEKGGSSGAVTASYDIKNNKEL